jgi:hypothetical protein
MVEEPAEEAEERRATDAVEPDAAEDRRATGAVDDLLVRGVAQTSQVVRDAAFAKVQEPQGHRAGFSSSDERQRSRGSSQEPDPSDDRRVFLGAGAGTARSVRGS